jgi:serine/threonine protein kinase
VHLIDGTDLVDVEAVADLVAKEEPIAHVERGDRFADGVGDLRPIRLLQALELGIAVGLEVEDVLLERRLSAGLPAEPEELAGGDDTNPAAQAAATGEVADARGSVPVRHEQDGADDLLDLLDVGRRCTEGGPRGVDLSERMSLDEGERLFVSAGGGASQIDVVRGEIGQDDAWIRFAVDDPTEVSREPLGGDLHPRPGLARGGPCRAQALVEASELLSRHGPLVLGAGGSDEACRERMAVLFDRSHRLDPGSGSEYPRFRTRPGSAMGCLDANLLQAWQDGMLREGERRVTEEHLDSCDECRQLVATLATDTAPHSPDEPAPSLTLGTTLPAQTRSHDAVLAAGARIGRFVVQKTLGIGGMGVVYAAEDPELGRQVAVKVLRGAVARNSALAAQRIMREARLAARVSHPNVVSLYEVGQHEDRVFIAMEMVIGHPLTVWLRERPRSPKEILEVFVDAGRGLAAAHAAGVVHRDFKPDNVLVGRDGRARVTDFGLARRGDSADEAGAGAGESTRAKRSSLSDLSHAGAVLGTPAYMAPEQHSGANTDPRTDQFSFCIALYEALHGQRPFDGKTWEELSEAVLAGRVKPPPASSHVPASLHRIVVRGLAVRPGDRFASMSELLEALGRDRGRALRAWAYASLVALVAAATALAGDWMARERTLAVTRSSFSAAGTQLGRSLKLRYEAFAAMSDLSYVVPVIRQVTGNVDDADFGLGAAEDDRSQLAELHANLRAADWVTWAKASQRGFIGIADYKGRLLYTGAAPDLWGTDVRVLSAVDSAYSDAQSGIGHAMVIRGDDPAMIQSGLLGQKPRQGLYVVFARATVVGEVARAAFVQTIQGAKLLDDVSLGEGVQLALVAPGGATDGGDIPARVLAEGKQAEGTTREVVDEGRSWLVQTHPLGGLEAGEREIARIILARPMEVGLAGLFPGARLVLGLLTLVLLVSTVASGMMARTARLRLTAPRL